MLRQLGRWTKNAIRRLVSPEHTMMARFAFHRPLDSKRASFPKSFDPLVHVAGEPLPLPGASDRMGYPMDDQLYLEMGRHDAQLILDLAARHMKADGPRAILDFGCSTGRVLRHFESHRRDHGWKLHGVDIQAQVIQWLREHFPSDYVVSTVSTMPQLPFPDDSFDVIYGISVFTHIKYLWDAWILELRRVLKPGGMLLQTFHAEPAWAYYHDQARANGWTHHPLSLYERHPELPVDYFYYGDVALSQVFWKASVARAYWGRYIDVIDVLPPPRFSFQNWIVCRKPG